jgi:hypothetical protein
VIGRALLISGRLSLAHFGHNEVAIGMQIKETFRDLKSHRWGFSLRYALRARPKRRAKKSGARNFRRNEIPLLSS